MFSHLKSFSVFSCTLSFSETKTYVFDAESEKDLKEWRETMQNVQLKLFAGDAEVGLQRVKSTNETLRFVCLVVFRRALFTGSAALTTAAAPALPGNTRS